MYMICTYKILFSCEFLPFVRVSLFLSLSQYFGVFFRKKIKKKKKNHKLTMFKMMVVFSFSFFFLPPPPEKKCKKMLIVKNFQNPQRKLTQIKL